MKRFAALHLAAIIGVCLLAGELNAQEGSSEPTGAARRSSTWLIITGGVGFAGSITREALEGFPKTKFSGNTSAYASLRIGQIRNRGSFCLDASLYRFKFGLEEAGIGFGDLEMTWFVVTPGLAVVNRKSGGGSFFLGFIGLGLVSSHFNKGPFIKDLENQYNGVVTVETEKNALAGVLFPIKVEYLFTKFLSVGGSVALLLSNLGTVWSVNGSPLSDFDKFFISNWQIHGVVSLLL